MENSTTADIVCGVYSGVKPGWFGPPMVNGFLTQYAAQDIEEYNKFNERLSWADNRRILRLSPLIRSDAGLYGCVMVPGGYWQIQVNVRGKY